jgi:hypothetical protein
MSVYTNHVRSASNGFEQSQPVRFSTDEYEPDVPSRNESLPNILPEVF